MTERGDAGFGDEYEVGGPNPLDWHDVPRGRTGADPLDESAEEAESAGEWAGEEFQDGPSLADRLAAEEPEVAPEPPGNREL